MKIYFVNTCRGIMIPRNIFASQSEPSSSSERSSPDPMVENVQSNSQQTKERTGNKRSLILGELEDELERQLEEKASRNELSVVNVKSLLRAVLTHEDVRKYVEFTLHKTDEQPEYQLKLTRAKAKDLIDKMPEVAPILCLPTPQKKSEIDLFINEDLSEDSSDEEYRPHDETIEDEDDSICDSVLTEGDESSSVTGEMISRNEFVAPPENIGQRTRSKLSLSQTPLETIEQSFVPPDITEDMYDTSCDNPDWLTFLKELSLPLTSSEGVEVNDDENDPEYNVMVDEETEDSDREELRMDKAVKVSKKELNALMTELFEYTQMLDEEVKNSDEEPCAGENEANINTLVSQPEVSDNFKIPEPKVELLRVLTPPPRPISPPPQPQTNNEVTELSQITNEQRMLILHQFMQHVQLLLQSHLLSCGNPYIDVFSREILKGLLEDIKTFGDSPKYPTTIFNFPTRKSTFDLIDQYEAHVKMNETSIKKWNMEVTRSGKAALGRTGLTPALMSLCLRSRAFQFPLLLPKASFVQSPASTQSSRSSFLHSEDILISLGLEDCETHLGYDVNSSKELLLACDKIRSSLLPCKSTKAIMDHVIRKKKFQRPNPIRDFFLHRTAPAIEHFVIPVYADKLTPLFAQPPRLVDTVWHRMLYDEKDRHKRLAAKRKLLTVIENNDQLKIDSQAKIVG